MQVNKKSEANEAIIPSLQGIHNRSAQDLLELILQAIMCQEDHITRDVHLRCYHR